MKLIIEIELGNAACRTPRDVAKLLANYVFKLNLKDKWDHLDFIHIFIDSNGNSVGEAKREEEE